MKKLLALLVIPLATLTGCAKYHDPVVVNSHQCERIIHQMHTAPGRYKSLGNKHLATVEAKLQKDYYHYNCNKIVGAFRY